MTTITGSPNSLLQKRAIKKQEEDEPVVKFYIKPCRKNKQK
jgi:hypothetical protein